ncbi:MAG TPA: hypothetical protein VIY66_01075 [Candidatus Acidoferrales bacterium]
MNAESSPRQGAKTSIWDVGTADLAPAVVARLYSVKGDIDFLKGAPLPIQIGQDEMSRQIAVSLGALIVGVMFHKSLGSLFGEAREQSLPPGRQLFLERMMPSSDCFGSRGHFYASGLIR